LFILSHTIRTITSIGRFFVLNYIKNQINNGKFGYNTLIVGGNKQAISHLQRHRYQSGQSLAYTFKGFVYADDTGHNGMSEYSAEIGQYQ
jgi:hypothetical protein